MQATSANSELKGLVREAHKRGMEIILDIVFNHTAEGNEQGPHISFRGVDNRSYYMLAPEGQYYNYSGCGNTFNCNDPIARNLILDCLRYWVQVCPTLPSLAATQFDLRASRELRNGLDVNVIYVPALPATECERNAPAFSATRPDTEA